jgi:hypothetical protein
VAEAESVWATHEQALATIRERELAHVRLFEQHGLDPRFLSDPDGLEREASMERNRLVELERALNALDASRAVGLLTSIDARVSALPTVVEHSRAAWSAVLDRHRSERHCGCDGQVRYPAHAGRCAASGVRSAGRRVTSWVDRT